MRRHVHGGQGAGLQHKPRECISPACRTEECLFAWGACTTWGCTPGRKDVGIPACCCRPQAHTKQHLYTAPFPPFHTNIHPTAGHSPCGMKRPPTSAAIMSPTSPTSSPPALRPPSICS